METGDNPRDWKCWFFLFFLLFFFLEKTAYMIQDPFRNRPSDTPVTSIARTIEINIKELIKDENIPEPLKPTDYYIL